MNSSKPTFHSKGSQKVPKDKSFPRPFASNPLRSSSTHKFKSISTHPSSTNSSQNDLLDDDLLTGVFASNPTDPSIPSITILPLGAGQDVGRSCLIVTFATGRTVMLDCGMHMGYNDRRMYPDFTYLTRNQDLTHAVDAVFISHFHLDHCGALPYMTETVGYHGPIVMSHPTKAICPILLEDFRRILGNKNNTKTAHLGFKTEDLQKCLSKVTCINVHQTIRLYPDLEVKAVS